GLSGWLYAHFQRTLSASAFGAEANIDYLVMAVLGGAGQVFGALLGSSIVIIIKDILQDLLGNAGTFQDLVFGILLVAVLQYSGEGLGPLLVSWLPRSKPWFTPEAAQRVAAPPVPRVATGPLLTVDRVTKRFGGLVAVDDVSLSVGSNEVVALIGPNGAG